MFRNNILHFAKFVSFDPTLIKECIVYIQVVPYKSTDLAAVNEARLVCYAVR